MFISINLPSPDYLASTRKKKLFDTTDFSISLFLYIILYVHFHQSPQPGLFGFNPKENK